MDQERGPGGMRQRSLPAILRPLRHAAYRRLAAGSLVSLFGDGVFLVALPLQVYAISNIPTAMAVVGAVWTTSQLLMLLVGGWAVDRFERRRIMIAADLLRGAALLGAGALSLNGSLELWHFGVVGAVVGASNAFFNPAMTSIVPDLLPTGELARANAFLGVARPAMVRLLGPAAGGLLVGTFGTGPAFLVDAGTFLVSAALLSRLPRRTADIDADAAASPPGSLRTVAEGLRFVRSHRWCWVWLIASAAGLLAFTGPVDMLLPYVVKNDLGLTQRQAAYFLGAVLAAGGGGSVLMALLVGQRGIPRRAMTAMYLAQALGIALLAMYGAMRSLWQGVLAAVLLNAMFTFTDIVWTTTLQRQVPRRLLGRVSSLDWMAALGAMPLSFVVAGRLAEVSGAREVLLAASGVGAGVVLVLMMVPGARSPEGLEPAAALTPALRDESR
ncbi:MAG TPA: MFS transporter [Egibacteraceae bacterium]|nr:MFS transporter [Egibacteraceae bacterium]